MKLQSGWMVFCGDEMICDTVFMDKNEAEKARQDIQDDEKALGRIDNCHLKKVNVLGA